MSTTVTLPAESSPAVSVPTDRQDYANWRMTGQLPAAQAAPADKQSKPEASATSKESSEEGHQASGKAPESDTGKTQEQKKPGKAEVRLNELLEDLRRAGLSPAELKTFKREMQQEHKAAPSDKTAPEQTAKPAGKLEPPKKPKIEDFKTYEEYDAARDEYYEKVSEYKAAKAVADDREERARSAAETEMKGKLADATKRYGETAVSTIGEAATAIFTPAEIPAAVKAILNDSSVMTDLLYVMGSKAEDLAEFVELAKTNPGAAIRRAVLMEKLVIEELAKGKASGETEDGTAGRDASGKFTAEKKAPEKKITEAPPPPKEVSGRGSAPPDEVESAAKSNDFRRFRDAANRRDISRRQGR